MKFAADKSVHAFAVAIAACTVCVSATRGQDSSLLLAPGGSSQQLSLEHGSFIFREMPPAARMRELVKHDIITVVVNYNTRMLSEGDAQNRKTSTLNAVLSSWLRFDGKSIKLAPQNDGDPRVQGSYTGQYRTQSDVELRDNLTFKVGAEIVEIRPNGNLYIEANWNIENNEERWRIFLSGEVRRESIQPDRTVVSDSIINLNIVKKEEGQVRDGYARGWFTKWWDHYGPF